MILKYISPQITHPKLNQGQRSGPWRQPKGRNLQSVGRDQGPVQSRQRRLHHGLDREHRQNAAQVSLTRKDLSQFCLYNDYYSFFKIRRPDFDMIDSDDKFRTVRLLKNLVKQDLKKDMEIEVLLEFLDNKKV